jgi:hypothetical protein
MTWTPALQEMFGHLDGVFFDCDQPEKLAGLIRRLYWDRARARELAQQQQAVCARFAWPVESQRYVAVMTGLVQPTEPLLRTAAA